MSKMRKLFYAPGIISLIGISFSYSFMQKKVSKKETIIELAVPKEKIPGKKEMAYFNVAHILKEINRKRKINFLLDEDYLTNKKKLGIIQFEARKLKYTFDTSSVILVKLSENTTYNEFVKLINVCISDSIQRFATWDNYFAIFGEYPPQEIKTDPAFTCFLCGDVITLPPPGKTFKEKVIFAFKPYLTLQSLILLTGWVTLVLTFLYHKKKSKSLH